MLDAYTFLKNLPKTPGVYQMFDAHHRLLYVGKAKNLSKRLASYFRQPKAPKTEHMMAQVVDIQVMQTHAETDALLLECELIKAHKPRYNILLRDDKSYPYLVLTHHTFPRLGFYRGARSKKTGDYFGPYPSTGALRDTVQLLQKIFLIRDCGDSYFSHRTRPCLQYQIKRCSAPCVGKIAADEYKKDIQSAKAFLQGKNEGVVERLQARMQAAAGQFQYETAAKLRDQIASIRQVQETQNIANKAARNVDIVAASLMTDMVVVNLLMVRDGRVLGDKNFLLKLPKEDGKEAAILAFLSQHYLLEAGDLPEALVCQVPKKVLTTLCQAIFQKRHQKVMTFSRLSREKTAWLEMAMKNATFAASQHQLESVRLTDQFSSLSISLKSEIKTIECFDVSHQQGEATVASDIVFNEAGPQKNAYRRFNVKGVTAGDDYGAMRQALSRRFAQTARALPDVLLIDGGKGQIQVAHEVLSMLGLRDRLHLLSIAKGRARRADMDTVLYHDQRGVIMLDINASGRQLLQFARDEAHRFAISAHQKTKNKRTQRSFLENIPGVGSARRRALINHFGGFQGLQGKSAAEIAKVPGISAALALVIQDYLRK